MIENDYPRTEFMRLMDIYVRWSTQARISGHPGDARCAELAKAAMLDYRGQPTDQYGDPL